MPAAPQTAAEVARLDNRALQNLMQDGFAIDPAALDDSEYRGISLGLPAAVVALTWRKFMKTFHREPGTGVLRGWNVRVVQDGDDTPCVPQQKGGRERCFGHYQVVRPFGYAMPTPMYQGLLIDYGLGGNSPLDPVSRTRDPIVALREGRADLLLGCSYLDLGFRTLRTPSFFTLERLGPLRRVEPVPG